MLIDYQSALLQALVRLLDRFHLKRFLTNFRRKEIELQRYFNEPIIYYYAKKLLFITNWQKINWSRCCGIHPSKTACAAECHSAYYPGSSYYLNYYLDAGFYKPLKQKHKKEHCFSIITDLAYLTW